MKSIEIRWHGRGGQGAVTSAELIAIAVISEGRYAQAFPSFGAERRGAPVLAFNRISEEPIRIRSEIEEPDVVVVLDPGLLRVVDVTSGLKDNGVIIINTKKSPDEIESEFKFGRKIATIDGTRIARETLGIPIVNTAMLGAVAKTTKILKLNSLIGPMSDRFKRLAKKNIKACKKAYKKVSIKDFN